MASAIIIAGVVSGAVRWLVYLSVKGYVKASANMKTTKKKSMINLKNQFEAIYEMNSRIHNMEAYVDKYLLKLKCFGITYTGWEEFADISIGLITVVAIYGSLSGYINGADIVYFMEILFSYSLTVACLFVLFHIFDIKSGKQQIHIQLTDYLENYLANRLLKDRKDVESGGAQSTMEEDMEMLKRLIREMDERRKDAGTPLETEAPESLEVAASVEMAMSSEMEYPEGMIRDQSDAELLEEFVESFLS